MTEGERATVFRLIYVNDKSERLSERVISVDIEPDDYYKCEGVSLCNLDDWEKEQLFGNLCEHVYRLKNTVKELENTIEEFRERIRYLEAKND